MEVGQHKLAFDWLTTFPIEGIAGETVIQVREALGEYSDHKKLYDEILALLKKHLAEIEAGDMKLHTRLEPICREIVEELNINTLPRLADYQRLASAEELKTEEKLAIAITGWLLGSGSSGRNLAVALSSVEVRNVIRQYMVAKQHAERRQLFCKVMASLEGANPENVAKLLANMKPDR